ncbi:MAG: sodium:proton antiporter [Actinomycetia bacterium]|nr:sodium:proton antiporter [Actinomycetes bacterium]
MHTFEYILVLLAAVLVSNLISQRFPKISTPLIQIALGIALVVTPFPFDIYLDPELFLILFIAPLLFEEAKKADKSAMWRLKRPILGLAIGLVFATCLIVGFVMHWLVPSLPLAAAFALAAALAPTDAVVIMSLKETASLGTEQKELLKGESLLNDAAAIVSFQFAIAAILTSSFSLIGASLTFMVMFLGGLAVGVATMVIRHFIIRAIRTSGAATSTFLVLFEVITPCLVFLIAELLHVSGIIAVVAAGIVYSYSPRISSPSTARQNIVSASVWSVISFTINGLVFLMLGAELPHVAQRIAYDPDIRLSLAPLLVVLIIVAMLLVRFIWILVMHRNVNLAGGGVMMRGRMREKTTVTSAQNDDSDPVSLENTAFTIDLLNHTGTLKALSEDDGAGGVATNRDGGGDLAVKDTAADKSSLVNKYGPIVGRDPTFHRNHPAAPLNPMFNRSGQISSINPRPLRDDSLVGRDPVIGRAATPRAGGGLREEARSRRQHFIEQRRRAIADERRQARSDPHYWKLHIKDACLLSLAGAKGAITLALVFTIPLTLHDGSPFPGHDFLVLIASGVILLSLILTNIAMPLLSPKDPSPLQSEDEVKAMVEVLRSVVHRIQENSKPNERIANDRIILFYHERIQRLKANNSLDDTEERILRAQIVAWEKEHAVELVKQGRFDSKLGNYYLDLLDRLSSLQEHRSGLFARLKFARDQMRSLGWRWSFIRKERRQSPDFDAFHMSYQLQTLQHECLDYALQRLEELKGQLAQAEQGATAATSDTGAAAADAGAADGVAEAPGTETSAGDGVAAAQADAGAADGVAEAPGTETSAGDGVAAAQADGNVLPPHLATLTPKIVNQFITDYKRRFTRSAQRIQSVPTMLPAHHQEELELRIRLRSLEWEREAISDALYASRISRQTAKQMFDNVAAMELDTEEFLE